MSTAQEARLARAQSLGREMSRAVRDGIEPLVAIAGDAGEDAGTILPAINMAIINLICSAACSAAPRGAEPEIASAMLQGICREVQGADWDGYRRGLEEVLAGRREQAVQQ